MTSEEFDRVVLAVVERVLSKMPDVIGNLMIEHARSHKIKKEFYEQYEEFKDHIDVVGAVLEQEESKELGQDYKKILENSVPKIKEQIRIKSRLNLVDNVSKDSLKTNLDKFGDFGEI